MTRVLEFTNQFSPEELANALMSAGFPANTRLSEIVAGKVDDVDAEVTLDCAIDEDDAVDALGDKAIIDAYRELGLDDENEREVEDAIRYVRAGQIGLASAMFARAFEGSHLRAAERALS